MLLQMRTWKSLSYIYTCKSPVTIKLIANRINLDLAITHDFPMSQYEEVDLFNFYSYYIINIVVMHLHVHRHSRY